jgi:frataxin-like iron-binding protein CyaY
MTNEEFQSLVLQQLEKINKRLDSLEEGQLHLTTRLDNVDNKVDKLELRLENEVIDKVRALFDGFALRGDQIERLQKHLDSLI